MAIIITSEQTIPIDEPFKVCAGPGAGKTHWLINHIKNVVSNSHKLDIVKKVACITYTNVGTDTITSRLNIGNDVVEVCTIHSFLYANVVKPYVHLVAEDFELKLDELVVIDDSNFKSEGTAKIVLNRIGKDWRVQTGVMKTMSTNITNPITHRFITLRVASGMWAMTGIWGSKDGSGVEVICLLMTFCISLIFCFQDTQTYIN